MKQIKFGMNTKSIEDAINEVQNYSRWIEAQTNDFVAELAYAGLLVGKQNIGNFNIDFAIEDPVNGVSALVGFSFREMREWWGKRGHRVTLDYAPILMAEYGSGAMAEEAKTLDDGTRVGFGTFPTNKQPRYYWEYRLSPSGQWESSYGETPTKPMEKAYEEMFTKVSEVARKVFLSR